MSLARGSDRGDNSGVSHAQRQFTESPDDQDDRCLVRSVLAELDADPRLEAVTVSHTEDQISVATMGKPPTPGEESRVTAAVARGRDAGARHGCGLLEGENNCQTCGEPLSDAERSRVNVHRACDETTVSRVTCPTSPRFWRWRKLPLPRFVQREMEVPEDDRHINEWKWQLLAAALCGVFGLTGYFLGGGAWSIAAYGLAFVAGAWFAAEESWEVIRKGALDVHFLMLAVAVGSASIGAWGEGVMLLFLFSMSGALEHYAMGRTQREIRSLFKAAPKVATVLDANGREREVPVAALKPGMRVLVRPDSQFPVDAEVARGGTAADESNLTGEATPAEKGVGDSVLAGTMNLWGAVEVIVTRPAGESALEKIVRLIRDAQKMKAPAQRFTDRFGGVYTYAILGLTAVMFFVWWLGFGLPPFGTAESGTSAFYRAMVLLVVASPCALVLSIPSAILAAIAWAARHGVLFRGGAAVEKLAQTEIVALDKTGTLTTGELRVERIQSFPPGREAEVLQHAYTLEKLSTHPLARAVTTHAKRKRVVPLEALDYHSVPGQGLKAVIGGRSCLLGKREFILQESGVGNVREELIGHQDAAPIQGHSEVWIAAGDLLGRLLLRDDVRPEAAALIAELKREGLRTILLTGDRPENTAAIEKELPLDEVRAGLKPDEKLEIITGLGRDGRKVAMVGDGVNDAPSLAAAHVGVAMGARGSDAALEQAEVVLMHDRLENFIAAFRLSQRARRIIRQNLVVSLGTVVVLVTFALAGEIPLTLGVLGHEGSTVIVVLNSLRLLFGGGVPLVRAGEP